MHKATESPEENLHSKDMEPGSEQVTEYLSLFTDSQILAFN